MERRFGKNEIRYQFGRMKRELIKMKTVILITVILVVVVVVVMVVVVVVVVVINTGIKFFISIIFAFVDTTL